MLQEVVDSLMTVLHFIPLPLPLSNKHFELKRDCRTRQKETLHTVHLHNPQQQALSPINTKDKDSSIGHDETLGHVKQHRVQLAALNTRISLHSPFIYSHDPLDCTSPTFSPKFRHFSDYTATFISEWPYSHQNVNAHDTLI